MKWIRMGSHSFINTNSIWTITNILGDGHCDAAHSGRQQIMMSQALRSQVPSTPIRSHPLRGL